jgi:hypothetical protein
MEIQMKNFKQTPFYDEHYHWTYQDCRVLYVLGPSRGVIDESQWITMLGALFPDAFTLTVSEDVSVMLLWPDSALLSKAQKLYETVHNGQLLDAALCQRLSEKNALEWWQDMPLGGRVEKCRDFEISIFAARRDKPPLSIQEDIEEMFA